MNYNWDWGVFFKSTGVGSETYLDWYLSGLGWTIAWQPPDREFIGRAVLEQQRTAGIPQILVGLVLEQRGVLRSHQPVYDGDREIGLTTSGAFSPTLNRGIALARVAADAGDRCQVEVRGKRLAALTVKPPFVSHTG